jgi:hypothetical protein
MPVTAIIFMEQLSGGFTEFYPDGMKYVGNMGKI